MEQEKSAFYIQRLENVLQDFIRKIHSEISHQLVEGITHSKFFVLKKIDERGRSKVSELAEDMCVSLSAVTSLVDKLCSAELVRRCRDEDDRRLVWLTLTPRGKEVLDGCLSGRREIVEKYFGQLPEEDIKQLVHIYEKLLNIMKSEKQVK